ncbi:MAG: cupin domain-containing protein [Thermomicrobiales bacterium]
MNYPANAPVINPSDETISIGPLVIRFLITSQDSQGSVSVFEFTAPAGESLRAPAHSHDAFEETVYGLSGVLTWTVDGQAIEVGPGQALCIPRGAVHRFDNFGTEAARQLVVASPGVFGPDYFREVAAAMSAAAGGPPDRAIIADIFRRYGLKPDLGAV